MASFRQAGKNAAATGQTAERAVLEYFRADMPAAELGAGLDQFLDGYGVTRNNPARSTLFERCVQSVSARGTARDARAVCATAGRSKYGQSEMTRRAAAGKRSASRRNPSHLAPRWDVENLQDGNWQVVGSVRAYSAKHAVSVYKEKHPEWSKGRKFRAKQSNPGRQNPADTADRAYEEFHGHGPDVSVTVVKRRHTHEFLAGAGLLRSLKVRGIDRDEHTIRGFRGALLAFNEQMNQLFIEGGDQSINLEDYGITEPHELETLGKVLAIDYETNKTHLGAEGGHAIYHHKFRTTNEGGQVVEVEIKRYPDLIYRVLDEQLEFSGGSYTIRREGIDF